VAKFRRKNCLGGIFFRNVLFGWMVDFFGVFGLWGAPLALLVFGFGGGLFLTSAFLNL